VYNYVGLNVKILFFNLTDDIAKSFAKFGIRNDRSSREVPLDKYLALATNLPFVKVLLYILLPKIILDVF